MAQVKIIGDLRENSKITVTGYVTGGTEASSRVQWFKTSFPILDGENGLEALSASKTAKVNCSLFGEIICMINLDVFISLFCWLFNENSYFCFSCFLGTPHTFGGCWISHSRKIHSHDSRW